MGEDADGMEALFLRVPPNVKEALQERARRNRRSMNAQAIVELIEAAEADAQALVP